MADRIDALLAEADVCLLPIADASSLPPAVFSDPDWYATEQQRLFRTGWIAVGRSSEVGKPNDYLTASIAGDPVVVVRARDGSLSALSNVCSHRSMTIIEGSGSAPSLQCPYHLWTFRHDGALLAAPGMEQAADFDTSAVCLPRFAVTEWHGWVLVNLDSTAVPPAAAAPTLDALLTEHRIGEVVSVGRLEYPSEWNWKISVENFLESYHHRGVHPDTLDSTYPGSQSFAHMPEGETWSAVDHVSVVDGSDPFVAAVMYPSLMFAVLRGFGMTWFRLTPVDATTSDLSIEGFVLPEFADDPEIGEMLLSSLAEINDEDVAVNRRTAEGLASQFAEPGRVSHLEGAPWHFRRWLVSQMGN